MKIKILMENQAVNESFACGHGLSIYVETGKHKIMMDAGPDWRFADNALRLGVDISDVDILVLSHGHYDHSGGLMKFMAMNDKAKIYAADGYCLPHYNENGAYIGVEPLAVDHPRITVLDGDLEIDEEVKILGFRKERLFETINTCGMTEGRVDGLKNFKIYPEAFAHEHYLFVNDGESSVLFSGCSHKGIINIATWAMKYNPTAIMGGFHLMGVKPENYNMLDHVAEALLELPMNYYTGHCTGSAQFEYLKERMGDRLNYAAAGAEFEI